MAINFPSNPSIDDTYTYNSKTWLYNGTGWQISSATETGNTEGNTGEIAYYDEKGSVIKGATAFKYDDTTGIVSFHRGISAGQGATFSLVGIGGLLHAGGGDDRGSIRSTLDPTTNITLGSGKLTLNAETAVEIESPFLDVDEIRGANGIITFETGSISMSIAGQKFLDAVYGGFQGTPIIAAYGISCGIGPAGVYTPNGITCGTLSVGGYWAGEQNDVVGIAIDNGTSVLTTGKKGHRILPWDCEVIEWTVSSSDSGSIQWDVNWCTYDNWPTTTSVGGLGLPSISSNYQNKSVSPNWTKKTFDAGNIIEFEIDSVTTLTNCILSIKIRRIG